MNHKELIVVLAFYLLVLVIGASFYGKIQYVHGYLAGVKAADTDNPLTLYIRDHIAFCADKDGTVYPACKRGKVFRIEENVVKK